MFLIDLVLQGVRKFVQSQRIPFKPGLNIVFGGAESGKTTLYDCILELLFPNRISEGKPAWQSWSRAEQSRAGLTLKNGEQVYRLLKDMAQNKISLSRKPPGSDKFERISSEPSEIASILAEEFGLIGWEDYKNLFLESALYLPSYKGIEKAAAQSKDAGFLGEPGAEQPKSQQPFPGQQFPGMEQPGFGFTNLPGTGMPGMVGMPGMPGMPGFGMPGMPGMPGFGIPGAELLGEQEDGTTWEEKEKKLEKLKAEMSKNKEVEELQFEIDGLQSKIFEISKQKEKVKKFDEEIKRLDEELEKYRFFRNLPENIEQRIEVFDSLQENKGKDLDGLDARLAEADDEIRILESQPKFYEMMIFKVGAGIAGGGILGMILNGIDLLLFLRLFFGFLIVAGLGAIGYNFWQYFTRLNKISELKAGLKMMEERRKTTAKDYEVKGAIVKRLLEQTQCDHTEELKEMLLNFQSLENQRTDANRKKKELLIELDWDKLTRDELELKVKISELEQKLKGMAVGGIDANETRREIERLEQTLNRARQLGILSSKPRAPASATTASPGAQKDMGKTQMVASAGRALPFWDRLLESGARTLGMKSDELFKQASARANIYLQAFSGKKYQEFRKQADSIMVRLADINQEMDLKEVGKTGMDLVYFSLKFALLEMLAAKFPFPIIIDEPYLSLDEARATAVAKTLKRLSQKTQVIALTSSKLFVKEADNALSLG